MITNNHAKQYINGEWIDSGDKKDTINPSTGDVLGSYVEGGKTEMQDAIKAAKDTFKNTDWKTNRDLRYRVLTKMADAFEARQDELATMIAKENGKAIGEAQFEASFVMPNIRFAASKIYTEFGRTAEWSAGKYSILVKEAIGVVLVNLSEGLRASAVETVASASMSEMIILGALPALLAAFCYPIGNQLVWQVSYNSRQHTAKMREVRVYSNEQRVQPIVNEAPILSSAIDPNLDHSYPSDSVASHQPSSLLQHLISRIPAVETDLLQDAFNKVWLMTLGSLPFWLLLGIIVRPEAPSGSQLFNTLLVALLAGVGATSIFLYARERAVTSSEVAGVDSTQASEVIFALMGGMLFLGNMLPSAMGLLGIGLIILGLILFAKDG